MDGAVAGAHDRHADLCPGHLGLDLEDAGHQPGQPRPQARSQALLLLDDVAGRVFVWRVLGRELLHRTGCLRHQVIIRDTSFTPSHVVVFYGSFPMYIVCGVASYLYAMTRLPLYSRGTSFPLVMAIAGPLMILPNVGLNEWGHAFWFMEELFSAPLHWGFVILGWSGLFAGGIAAQIITRYSNLTDVVWNGQSKVILNNRIVPYDKKF